MEKERIRKRKVMFEAKEMESVDYSQNKESNKESSELREKKYEKSCEKREIENHPMLSNDINYCHSDSSAL